MLAFALFWALPTLGQISPGPLTDAHADLEGLSNCTQCHKLGDKVLDTKCLECHVEIQSLVNRSSGLHGNPTVVEQNCVECHGEHNGRRFDMVRFDQEAFDHMTTGYELEGQHAKIECRECHNSENIGDGKLKKKEKTFLGLDDACLSCHEDYHQGTLAEDCRECHDLDGFQPAPLFDHAHTDFELKGEHTEVDCKECHPMTVRNEVEFQKFAGISFDDCSSCHQDPHNSQLPGQCAQCHTESSFTTFKGQGNFAHTVTGFELRGSHGSLDCFACHKDNQDPLRVFQDQPHDIVENDCISCHDDVHEGLYGNDCVQCHRESSFLSLRNMDFFDHGVTDYPLEGQHVGVDCRACHEERFSDPIDFSSCISCHEDYHEGEFTREGVTADCVECHSLEHGFDFTLYTLEQHQSTDFPLKGAHMATPCFACHIDERDEKWTFTDMGTTCVDCHQDIHQGYMDTTYYPDKDCARCHGNDNWTDVDFDHGRTDWPLDGKHLEVACSECHFKVDADAAKGWVQQFDGLAAECATCHENVHGLAFEIEGVTDCARCHVTKSWDPELFDHDSTDFPLEGQHDKVACSACHEVVNAAGETVTLYQLNKFECIDCHLQ
ncbi:cytochrome c family protein [Flagellimonas marinaquae]|uniref:cytochrome c family protein n=1 Tax=Flagellimonas marinaquae TaxID=254955 RepID=UPI000F8C74BA|nr:cytochrome c family protein [Allomuricauda aquimarina]